MSELMNKGSDAIRHSLVELQFIRACIMVEFDAVKKIRSVSG